MSNQLIKYAFTGGEISPTLFGRSDLEQYDLGLALARNWIVDYRGGLSTRPGTEFIDFVKDDDKQTRFVDFTFSPDTSNSYCILFGHFYIRFIQDGGYVLEADKTITNVVGDVVTSNAHGFANGDWVKIFNVGGISNINARTYEVFGVTANTFRIKIVPDGSAFVPTGAYTAGGVAARIYTVVSPYDAADLSRIKTYQRRDLVRITRWGYPIHNLTRMGHTNWVLAEEDIGIGISAPTGVTAAASGAGSAGTVFAVTAIGSDGEESAQSLPFLLTGIVNYTTTAGSVTINWDTHPNAVAYNVYRTIVAADGTKLTKGEDLGFIGKVQGTQFIDSNIIPDFAKTPPQRNDPFGPGQILDIFVTAGGAGYTTASTMTVTGGAGSGFVGYPIVNAAGAVTGVRILNRGVGYTAPITVSFTVGAGATATATASDTDDIWPAVSAIFQQRQMYGATPDKPLTFWASRPNKLSNFSFSDVTLESDSYEFEIDSASVAPIRHMLPMRGGLLIMTESGIWQLTGGGQGGVVTPTNALADPQTYSGVSLVDPVKIGSDLLYIEGKGYTVRLLSYNEYARVYSGVDRSILSNHFFGQNLQITRWAFSENPNKIVYARREDGVVLTFTILKEQEVYAWTMFTTRGIVRDLINILEDDYDRVYMMVERHINGRKTRMIERVTTREFAYAEDAFCVDSGLTLGATFPAANLDASATTGDDVLFTASAAVFAPGDVGKILRMGGGKINVETYVSATQVRGKVVRDITATLPETDNTIVLTQVSGTWTLDAKVTTISGLWHLEGETVSILGDGNVFPEQEVVNGSITLSAGVTRAIVGLKFTSIARTLPPVVSDAIIEARTKRIVGVAARVNETRGLKTGYELDNLYEAKERTTELMGEPIALISDINDQLIEPIWEQNGQIYFVQDNPLPATLLGLVFDMEVGDDPE